MVPISDNSNLKCNERVEDFLFCDENLDSFNDHESQNIESFENLNSENENGNLNLNVSAEIPLVVLFHDVNGEIKDELMSGFKVQSEECILNLVKKETEFLVESGYVDRFKNGDLDLGMRNEAIRSMFKVIARYNYGPLCAYLAVSYMDRILSATDQPDQDWKMHLLALACLSVAAKIEEIDVPGSLELQEEDSKFMFDANLVKKWELGLLSTLKWRMQAITPFAFLDHFLYKINGEQTPLQSVMTESTMRILSLIRGIEFLDYRPSEIAAAVALSVCVETQTVEVDKSLQLLIEYVQKDRVLKCIEMVEEVLQREADEGLSGSPTGVLDASLSFKSDESPVRSSESSHESPGSKRRRLF